LEIKVMKLGTKTETKPKPIPWKVLRTKTKGSIRTSQLANTVSNSFGDF
jgi:hypothetical protein